MMLICLSQILARGDDAHGEFEAAVHFSTMLSCFTDKINCQLLAVFAVAAT